MWSLSSQCIGASVGSTKNTASSTVAYWIVFELLPGNASIKSVTKLFGESKRITRHACAHQRLSMSHHGIREGGETGSTAPAPDDSEYMEQSVALTEHLWNACLWRYRLPIRLRQ
jgi:hypothetical protein